MQRIETHFFDEQSFTDAKLISMQVNHVNKSAIIFLEGGWYIENDKVINLNNVSIEIQNWSDINILINSKNIIEYKKDHPNYNELLGSICEFKWLEYSKISGYGAGNDGGWEEWTFTNARIQIIGDVDND